MNKKSQLLPLFITVLIDMIGVGIIIPILAPLLENSDILLGSGHTQLFKNFVYGVVIAVFPFFQFFGSPILGAISDQIGRKKVLAVSIFGTFLGYLITSFGIFTGNIVLIIIGRAIDGLTGGNISVANSAIADISSKEDRAKNFGLIGVAFGIGFIVGPLLGGLLSDSETVSWFSPAFAYLVASILALFNFFLIQYNFQETLTVFKDTKVNLLTGFTNLKKAFKYSQIEQLFLVSFLYMVGFTAFTQVFQLYLVEVLKFDNKGIGMFYALNGVWIILIQGGIVPITSKKWTPTQILRTSLLGLSISLIVQILFKNITYLYWVMPLLAIFNGLTRPNMTALISNESSDDIQGEIQGINQSLSSVALAVTPIVGSLAFGIHPTLPMIGGAVVLLIAWGIIKWGFTPKSENVLKP